MSHNIPALKSKESLAEAFFHELQYEYSQVKSTCTDDELAHMYLVTPSGEMKITCFSLNRPETIWLRCLNLSNETVSIVSHYSNCTFIFKKVMKNTDEQPKPVVFGFDTGAYGAKS